MHAPDGWAKQALSLYVVLYLFLSFAHAQITHRMLPPEALLVSTNRFGVCELEFMLQRRKNIPILSRPEWHGDFENSSHSLCQMSFSLCVRRFT